MWSSECRRCRAMLPAYVHRELQPRARRRVSAHLARCAACDAEFGRQCVLTRALTDEIAAVGRTTPPLGRMWSQIQAQMVQPRARRGAVRFHKRYGAAAVLLIAALLLPSVLSETPRVFASLSVPTQQTPPELLDTPERTQDNLPRPASTPIVMLSVSVNAGNITPSLQSNYAPDGISDANPTADPALTRQITDIPDGD